MGLLFFFAFIATHIIMPKALVNVYLRILWLRVIMQSDRPTPFQKFIVIGPCEIVTLEDKQIITQNTNHAANLTKHKTRILGQSDQPCRYSD